MKSKTLKNGFSLPVLGYGTWKLAGEHKRDPNADVDRAKKAIRYAISQGMTHIDTAEMYGMGQTEEVLGEAITGIKRSDLFITSKVMGPLASHAGIHKAIDNTLKRLKTDYVDLYLIHWRDERFTIEEQMRAMNELYDVGKIRNIGVSNFSKESLQKAQELSKVPIVLNQVHYNLMYRGVETSGLLEYCQSSDVILQAYRPVQYGELSHDENLIMLEMCQKYQVTPSQVAMNWLIAQDHVVTLFMSKNPVHIDENLKVLDWEMKSEDVERLRNEFPGQIDATHVPLG